MTKAKHPSKWQAHMVRDEELACDFRDIPGTSGNYRCSPNGVVISRFNRKIPEGWWMVVKVCPMSRPGHKFNQLSIMRKRKHLSRVMLETFVGPPPTQHHKAAHRNGNTLDDRLENLVWASPSEVVIGRACRGNNAHAERQGSAKWTTEQIKAIRKIHGLGVSGNLIASSLGVPQSRISEILRGKKWVDQSKWDGVKNPLEGGAA